MNTATASQSSPEAQDAIRRRLDEIWATAGARDFDRLQSFHLYGPKFTEFKNGGPRADATSGAAAERAFFSRLEDMHVDMRDLAVNVFGDVALATFNGHYTGRLDGHPIGMDQQTTLVFVMVDGDWKIVHEHMSPLGPPAGGPPGGPPPRG